MTFILILLLVIFLIARFWPRIVVWMLRRHVRKQFDAFTNTQQQGAKQQSRRNPWGFGQQKKQQPKQRTKIFSKEEGEYVEFEEIPTYNGGTEQQTTHIKYKTESQISDAEWEDIK